MDTIYVTEQADLYCDGCGPGQADAVGFYPDETDTPRHCTGCEALLPQPLTPDGIVYVEAALVDYLVHGHGRLDVLDQWADQYGELLDGAIVDAFTAATLLDQGHPDAARDALAGVALAVSDQ